MQPTGLDTLTDAVRAVRAVCAVRAVRVEQLSTLADDHDALAKEFHARHE
jgi:hypothetical protein